MKIRDDVLDAAVRAFEDEYDRLMKGRNRNSYDEHHDALVSAIGAAVERATRPADPPLNVGEQLVRMDPGHTGGILYTVVARTRNNGQTLYALERVS